MAATTYHVDDGKVLDVLGNAGKHLVHLHTHRIMVMPKSHDDDAVTFGHDGLIDGPARTEVRKHVRHGNREEEDEATDGAGLKMQRAGYATETCSLKSPNRPFQNFRSLLSGDATS